MGHTHPFIKPFLNRWFFKDHKLHLAWSRRSKSRQKTPEKTWTARQQRRAAANCGGGLRPHGHSNVSKNLWTHSEAQEVFHHSRPWTSLHQTSTLCLVCFEHGRWFTLILFVFTTFIQQPEPWKYPERLVYSCKSVQLKMWIHCPSFLKYHDKTWHFHIIINK